MLLSSILRILDQHQTQSPNAVKRPDFEPYLAAATAAQEATGLEKIELEIAAAAGQLKPSKPDPQIPAANLGAPSLDELLRTIADLKKPDRLPFVDVFE